MGNDLVLAAAVAGLILVAAFLAVAETGLVRMTATRATALQAEGRRGATTLARLLDHPERPLNTVLLLVLFCQLSSATILGVLAERHLGAIGVAVAAGVQVAVVFVVAEAMPKTWAVQHTESAALLTAPVIAGVVRLPPLRWISRALIGLANVILPGKGLERGPFVTEQELLAMADQAAGQAAIEREEREFIHSVFAFGDTVVRKVMVPRTDITALQARTPVEQALAVAVDAGLSRLPVYGRDFDDVAGIAFVKDLLRATREGRSNAPVGTIARAARFVPETKRIAELMREMQAGRYHMALVVDEYGGTAGLVTLEDLLEELVGEIVDEYDVEEPRVELLADGGVRVGGFLPVDELEALLGAPLPRGDWETVAGLLVHELGHLPVEGESAVVDGYALWAEKVHARRVGRVRVVPVGAEG